MGRGLVDEEHGGHVRAERLGVVGGAMWAGGVAGRGC